MNIHEMMGQLEGEPRPLPYCSSAGSKTWALPDQSLERVKALKGCTIVMHGMDKVDVLAGKVVYGVKLDEGDATIIASVHLDERDGSQSLRDVQVNFHPK